MSPRSRRLMNQAVLSGAARWRLALLCALAWLVAHDAGAQPAPTAVDRGLAVLYERVEQTLLAGDGAAFLRLIATVDERAAAETFASQQFVPGATRAVVRERDRDAIIGAPADSGFHVLVDVFVEFGTRGSARTWRLDVVRRAAPAGSAEPAALEWSISAPERVTSVDGLYRLALDRTKQFRINNLKVTAEDLTISIPSGVAFAAVTPEGPTAFVLIGRGETVFSPPIESERGQVRVFAGDDVLRTNIDGAFLRLNPWDARDRLSSGGLVEMPVDLRDQRRADTMFSEEIGKSFSLELSDLSRDQWSLVPPQGDFLTEIRTQRFGTLTYARSNGEPEDITVFDRKHRRNIAVYASTSKLAARGSRFYNEDDDRDYDVLHYAIQTHFEPKREWIEGRTEVQMRVRSAVLGTLTLRLAESLVVRSVTAQGIGRMMTLRVKGQNSVIVNLPRVLARNDEITLIVTYAGRLPGAIPEREALALGQQEVVQDQINIPGEPRTVYTNRSYWYPQAPSTDFATAMLRLTMPDDQACVASGTPASGNPVRVDGPTPLEKRRLYVFVIDRPARYFAVALTRLEPMASIRITAPAVMPAVTASTSGATAQASDGPPAPTELALGILANPRQTGRTRSMQEQVVSVWSVYASILGEFPYPTFSLALVDDPLPGGHSPAYFALLHQPLPTSPYSWRNDPVSFDNFPQFFLAHEVAHQYWGNAVGWQNYHEQWISEGFAQYFALLYAERTRSRDDVEGVLRQLRRTASSYARNGPIWLGYRLGHLQGDSRIFRALVYNKGALVLHMLRRLLGDDAFFRGLRRFYQDSKFQKVGTGEVQRAFELESGQSLTRFFDQWILGSDTPAVRLTYRVEESGASPPPGAGGLAGAETSTVSPVVKATGAPGNQPGERSIPPATVVVRLEQVGKIFDFPVTVTLEYASGASEDILVRVTDRVVETRVASRGPLRDVELNRDNASLVDVRRN